MDRGELAGRGEHSGSDRASEERQPTSSSSVGRRARNHRCDRQVESGGQRPRPAYVKRARGGGGGGGGGRERMRGHSGSFPTCPTDGRTISSYLVLLLRADSRFLNCRSLISGLSHFLEEGRPLKIELRVWRSGTCCSDQKYSFPPPSCPAWFRCTYTAECRRRRASEGPSRSSYRDGQNYGLDDFRFEP